MSSIARIDPARTAVTSSSSGRTQSMSASRKSITSSGCSSGVTGFADRREVGRQLHQEDCVRQCLRLRRGQAGVGDNDRAFVTMDSE